MDKNSIYALKPDGFQQIIDVFSHNSEITDKISLFRTSVELLNRNQQKLMDLHTLLDNITSSSEKNKENFRTDLINKLFPTITIVQIFAYDKKKKNLLKRVEHLSLESLHKFSDFQLVNLSKKIWTIANKYGGYSLAFINKAKSKLNRERLNAIYKLEEQYGLIPTMIKNIEDANIKFIEALLHYEVELKEKEKIVSKIYKIYHRSEMLLENKIDRFVSLIENEKPEFYKEYHAAKAMLAQNALKEQESNDEQSGISAVDESEVVSDERNTIHKKTFRPRQVKNVETEEHKDISVSG